MTLHRESKQLRNIQLTLAEVGELLELIKQGVRKVNPSVTVYQGMNSVEVTSAADLARDTLVADIVKDYTIEVEAGRPYKERVSINCRTNGKIMIEVVGDSEEWVLGKLTLATRYLESRERRITVWLRRLARFWLFCLTLVILECLNYWTLRRARFTETLRLLRATPLTGLVLTMVVATIVGIRTTGFSLLEVHPVSTFRKSLARDLILPISVGLSANVLFYILTRLMP